MQQRQFAKLAAEQKAGITEKKQHLHACTKLVTGEAKLAGAIDSSDMSWQAK